MPLSVFDKHMQLMFLLQLKSAFFNFSSSSLARKTSVGANAIINSHYRNRTYDAFCIAKRWL